MRLFEVVTHNTPRADPTALLEFLAGFVLNEFDEASSNVWTICRKAVTHLDEAMNLDSVLGVRNNEGG